MFSYTVRRSFKDQQVAVSWLNWLMDEHVQDVINSGATAAEIFQMDQEQIYEIRYRFRNRAEFETYESEHAPRLREEGLAKFPLDLGLEYSRCTGQSLKKFNC